MNCFQKFVSLTSETAQLCIFCAQLLLWIAFKSLYLWHRKQRQCEKIQVYICCELLSKVCIFDIGNSFVNTDSPTDIVVNCFQKFVSLTSETALLSEWELLNMLWIAFKSLYLWHRKQRSRKPSIMVSALWIAFKSLYLWHRKQLCYPYIYLRISCELLSKVCIFDIGNSY